MFEFLYKYVGRPIAYVLAVIAMLITSPIWVPLLAISKVLKLGGKCVMWALNLWKTRGKVAKFVKSTIAFIIIFPITPVATAAVAWDKAGQPTDPNVIGDMLMTSPYLGSVLDAYVTMYSFVWNYGLSFVS